MADQTESPLSQASQTTPPPPPMSLAGALASLDPDNDADWTADGKPRIEAVEALVGASVSRDDVDQIAPDLTRATAPNPKDGQELSGGAEAASAPGISAEAQDAEEATAAAREGLSAEERLVAVEEDLAFLRRIYGWPTKA